MPGASTDTELLVVSRTGATIEGARLLTRDGLLVQGLSETKADGIHD